VGRTVEKECVVEMVEEEIKVVKVGPSWKKKVPVASVLVGESHE